MKITSNKSGGTGLISAPEFPSNAGVLTLAEGAGDKLAIARPAEVVVVTVAGGGYELSV